jgi:hypothetical protein
MSSSADDSAGCLQVRRTEIRSRILRAVASRCEWACQEVASLAAAAPGTYNCSESARMESSGLLDFALAGVRRFHSVHLMPGAVSRHPLCGWQGVLKSDSLNTSTVLAVCSAECISKIVHYWRSNLGSACRSGAWGCAVRGRCACEWVTCALN